MTFLKHFHNLDSTYVDGGHFYGDKTLNWEACTAGLEGTEIVSQKQEGIRQSDFFGGSVCYEPMSSLKNQRESSCRGKETSHILLENFSVFAKMTVIWSRISQVWLGISSLSPSMLVLVR